IFFKRYKSVFNAPAHPNAGKAVFRPHSLMQEKAYLQGQYKRLKKSPHLRYASGRYIVQVRAMPNLFEHCQVQPKITACNVPFRFLPQLLNPVPSFLKKGLPLHSITVQIPVQG
ncbi:MAG: hypothetical protein LBV41_02830, partial [Cytophagaceae bacterium]|nr:hypothetical protein [Cytophagaceae bacterium]